MAAIICLISLALCRLSADEILNDSNQLISNNLKDDIVLPLNAQFVSIPRVYVSPCPEIFRYSFNGKEWFAIVVVKKPSPKGFSSKIKILLSIGLHLSARYVGEISLVKDRQSAVNDIANGGPLLYRVRFPLQNPVPKLTAIYYNDQLICTGPKDVGQFVTTITLDHTLYTGLTNLPLRPHSVSSSLPETSQSVWLPPQTTRKPVPHTTLTIPSSESDDRFGVDFSDFECGTTDYKAPTTTGLVVGGQTAQRTQFPWLAAYYHNGVGDSGFICGGSLISTKLIVTAAHCIQYKKDPLKRKAEEASFYLGKHNLESLNGEKNYIVSGVSKFIIHSDWNFEDDRYDADIAIAVLYRTIPFSKFVKPICLWTQSSNHDDLVGKSGRVAGWGKTEFDAISTSTPKWAELPVVSTLTCIRSNDALNKITSERTFCAGNRISGVGPCLGDSGGGFVAKNGEKWFLRGIVSSSLYDQAISSCDTKNYAVFTDVSKFTRWVQQHIQMYG